MYAALPINVIIVGTLAFICGFVLFLYITKRNELIKVKSWSKDNEASLRRRIYEVSVLEELNERFGLSLNIEKVIDTVVGSLSNLIKFSAVSYILLDGNKIVYKIQLEEELSRDYVDEIKKRMRDSLSALTTEDLSRRKAQEFISGSLIDSEVKSVVVSFFNIPLVINSRVVGVFNISSTKPGLYMEPEITLLYKIIERATKAVSKLEDVIEQEKGKLEAMVQSLIDGVLMVDRDFRILVVNPACLRMLNINKPNPNIFDVVGAFKKLFPLEETLAEVFDKGVAKTMSEIHIDNKYVQLVAVPVRVNDLILGVGLLLHDQSEEQELRRLREDFTAMVIHELRSPLTVIMGTSDLLIKESSSLGSEQIEGFLNSIKNSTKDLLDVVNDLLDSAKLESGKFEIYKSEADLNKFLRDESSKYINLAASKNLNFEVITTPGTAVAAFDYAKMTQVLNNLLSNAIKYTDSGKITVMSEITNNNVMIIISDTGGGISDPDKLKLFNKFHQIRTSPVSNEKGTGLGLVIAKGIVEAHGGKIWIEDNHPVGSKFIFTLPK